MKKVSAFLAKRNANLSTPDMMLANQDSFPVYKALQLGDSLIPHLATNVS
jgi:hypothetical protein